MEVPQATTDATRSVPTPDKEDDGDSDLKKGRVFMVMVKE